jgi:iron complex transport system permease protein
VKGLPIADAFPNRFRRPFPALAVTGALVVLVSIWAAAVGTASIPIADVFNALFAFDGSREHIVVLTIRLPRVLAGLLAGAALATAGAVMQAITNNPLASPGLLGINAGAAFSVVFGVVFLRAESTGVLVWYAFGGAALAAVIVYAIGSFGRAGPTPLKLALSGAILTSFVTSLTTAVLIFDQSTLDQVRLWSAGSLSGRSLSTSAAVAPYLLVGLAAAVLFSRQIMTLSLGTHVARSVGQNQTLWRGLGALMVVLLAGSAVALAGPIGFVGLVIPHIARLVVGVDYRWIIPFSTLGGALLTVTADAVGRFTMPEQDLPVGITMAMIGAPFFIYLVRNRMRTAS